MFQRYAPIDDLATRSEGGARFIDAYAAVFSREQEIRDREGHYMERIAPTAFDRTLSQRGSNFQVLFNHGRTIHGDSSERYSMPYGVPAEVRADARGVWTSTKIMDTPLGDEVHTLARDGALRGMSFSGQFKSTRAAGKHADSGLNVKERTEIAMTEYGATPFPAYGEAQIVAVRAEFATYTDDELRSLLADDADLAARVGHILAGLSPDTGRSRETSTSLAPERVALTAEQASRLTAILTRKDRT